MRSARSRNSGAGGLCAVRMAFDAELAQRGQPPLPHRQRDCRAHRAAVGVQRHAQHFVVHAIEEEALVWRRSGTRECRRERTSSSTGLPSRSSVARTVYIAPWPMSQRSGLAMVVSAFRSAVAPGARSSGCASCAALPARTALPFGRGQLHPQRELRRRGGLIRHRAADVDRRRVGHHRGRGDERPPGNDVRVAGGDQPHLAVDPRAGIPARSGLLRVVHAHRNHILARAQVRRQLVDKAHVAVRPVPQQLAIQVDIAVGHHSVEDDERPPRGRRLRIRRGNGEALAVPADAGRHKCARALRWRVFLRPARRYSSRGAGSRSSTRSRRRRASPRPRHRPAEIASPW